MAKVTFSTIDRQSKPTSLTVGADDAVLDATVQALADALDAIITGADLRAVVQVPNIVDIGSATPPADKSSDRGNKWLFRTQEATTGKIFKNELGTRDATALPTATDDYVDLTAGVGLAVKTAWETLWTSDEGRAGTLLSIQQVTRSD